MVQASAGRMGGRLWAGAFLVLVAGALVASFTRVQAPDEDLNALGPTSPPPVIQTASRPAGPSLASAKAALGSSPPTTNRTASSPGPSPSAASTPCQSVLEHDGRIVLEDCTDTTARPRGEAGARHFLEAHAPTLGLRRGTEDLQTLEVKHGLASTRTHFDQHLGGLPVHAAHVTVSQNAQGQITRVYSTYVPTTPPPAQPPRLGDGRAEAIARAAAASTSLRLPSKAELVWFTSSGAELRLAWRVMIYSEHPLGDFLTLVDDATGKVLSQENRIALATGIGLIFEPNPIQTSADTGLTDGNDASNPALDAERVDVPLLGLDDGVGTLRGEYVDLVSLPGGTTVPDADEPTRVYAYDRSDPRFEQVNIYSAIDRIQRYIHSLGFDDHVGIPNGIRDFPTLAHAHWNADDQSFYSTGDDAVHFGDGGVDDGEDADIIAHEYGHAIQHDQNACWGGGEMGAMGEGFGDYLAASFFFDRGDPTFQSAHAACVGEWDASSYSGQMPPCLRRIDGTKRYPADLQGSVHADGEIWSRALWDLRASVGGPTADTLVLEHHFNLPCNATMPDAANALLQADVNLNEGLNAIAIQSAFCARGILTGADCVPPPSIALAQTLSPANPAAGTLATLSINAVNVSLDVVEGVVMTAALPTGATYVSGSASHAGSASGGMITWPARTLVPGEEVIFSYQILLDPGPGTVVVFADDMESGGSAWVADHTSGAVDWALSSAKSRSPTNAWLATEPPSITDQRLTTAAPIHLGSGATLSFWHDYDLETGYDGGVLEISTDGGVTWSDLGAAMTQHAYPGVIAVGYDSPISNRSAFTGTSAGFVNTIVDLAAFADSSVLLRFRMASDNSVGLNGWTIDDVSLSQIVSLESVVSISGGATNASTLMATVAPPLPNSPPVITTNLGLTLVASGSSVIDGTRLGATDPDLTDTLTYTVLTPPLHGALTPTTGFTQAEIDSGALVYQHGGGAATSDAFTVRVLDGRGGESGPATFTLTITPANRPPEINLSALPGATADAPYLLSVTPTDPDAGDTLSLFLDAGPAWLGAPDLQENGEWLLVGTPLGADVGTTSVTLRVRDSGTPPLETSLTLGLTVAEAPPRVPGLGWPGGAITCVLGLRIARRRLAAAPTRS